VELDRVQDAHLSDPLSLLDRLSLSRASLSSLQAEEDALLRQLCTTYSLQLDAPLPPTPLPPTTLPLAPPPAPVPSPPKPLPPATRKRDLSSRPLPQRQQPVRQQYLKPSTPRSSPLLIDTTLEDDPPIEGPPQWPSVLDPPRGLEWGKDDGRLGGGVDALELYMETLTANVLMEKARYCRPPHVIKKAPRPVKSGKGACSKETRERAAAAAELMGNPALALPPVERRGGGEAWVLKKDVAQQLAQRMAQLQQARGKGGEVETSPSASESDDEETPPAGIYREDSEFSLLTRSIPWAEVALQFRVADLSSSATTGLGKVSALSPQPTLSLMHMYIRYLAALQHIRHPPLLSSSHFSPFQSLSPL
jgi:hypothetical protein